MSTVTDAVATTFDELLVSILFGPHLNRIQRLILLISRLAALALDADAGSVWFLRKNALHRAVIVNRPADLLHSFVMDMGKGLAAEAAQRCQPVVSDNARTDPRAARPDLIAREGLSTYVGCPVMVGPTCIGVISLFRKKPVPFTPREVQTLSGYADLLGLAIYHCSTCFGLVPQWEHYIRTMLVEQTEGSPRSATARKIRPIWVLMSSLPKGIHPVTLARVTQFLDSSESPVSCADVARVAGISGASARRYLNYLAETGVVKRDVKYSRVGRPSYTYYSISSDGDTR